MEDKKQTDIDKKKKESKLQVAVRYMTKYKIIKTNLRCFCICIFMMALYFLVISVLLTVYARKDYLFKVRVDNQCEDLGECNFDWVLDQDLEAPVYFLFGFEDFFVNHRSIALSTFEPQLTGKEIGTEARLKEFCGVKAMTNENLIALGQAIQHPTKADYIQLREVGFVRFFIWLENRFWLINGFEIYQILQFLLRCLRTEFLDVLIL